MAEMKMEVASPRAEAKAARLKLIREGSAVPTVKVFAGSEDMRRVLKHPTSRIGFRSMGEAAEWPNDSFTVRRIRDGSVRLEGAGAASASAAGPEDETQNARERAAARRPKPESKPEAKAAPKRPEPLRT